MASDGDFVDYVAQQAGLGKALTYKKMFGEYALYLHGTVIAFVCNNQLYVKPTAEGRRVLGTVVEGQPYPNAKPYFLIDAELDDRERLQRLLKTTALALPAESEIAADQPRASQQRRRYDPGNRRSAASGVKAS